MPRLRRLALALAAALAVTAAPALASGGAISWGENRHGQLGTGYTSEASPVPLGVLAVPQATAVAGGLFFSLAVQADGTITSWGGGDFGQLGDGTRKPINPVPRLVTGLQGATSVAAGGAGAIALLSNGAVVAWGNNKHGELGNGTIGNGTGTAIPVPVNTLNGLVPVTAIAAGGGDNFALLATGQVLGWGENRYGQLGDGTKLDKATPTLVAGLTGVTAVSAGGSHTLALQADGTILAWGLNIYGQLGDGTVTNRITPAPVKSPGPAVGISAGAKFSLAALADGQVAGWGGDSFGQLGIGHAPNLCTSAKLPCAKLPVTAPGIAGATSVSAGYQSSLALAAGRIYSFGRNQYGQLGDGTRLDRNLPVQVQGVTDGTAIAAAEEHMVAILASPSPPPALTITPGAAALTINWTATPAEAAEPWKVRWRLKGNAQTPWGAYTTIPATSRSFTVTGLTVKAYEVALRKGRLGGARTIAGTPLAAGR